MQKSPETADETCMPLGNWEHAGRNSALLHPALERRQAQPDQRTQEPWSPFDTPELDPERQIDIARGAELANHPVIVDAIDVWNTAISRHAQDHLGHPLEVPPAHQI